MKSERWLYFLLGGLSGFVLSLLLRGGGWFLGLAPFVRYGARWAPRVPMLPYSFGGHMGSWLFGQYPVVGWVIVGLAWLVPVALLIVVIILLARRPQVSPPPPDTPTAGGQNPSNPTTA